MINRGPNFIFKSINSFCSIRSRRILTYKLPTIFFSTYTFNFLFCRQCKEIFKLSSFFQYVLAIQFCFQTLRIGDVYHVYFLQNYPSAVWIIVCKIFIKEGRVIFCVVLKKFLVMCNNVIYEFLIGYKCEAKLIPVTRFMDQATSLLLSSSVISEEGSYEGSNLFFLYKAHQWTQGITDFSSTLFRSATIVASTLIYGSLIK